MIQIIIDEERDRKEGDLDCCHIIIDDHGIKKEKVISTETLYEILKTSQVSTKRELFLGRMPRGYVATKQEIQDFPKIKSKTAVFFDEGIRRIIYEDSIYEIPIPNLLMIHSVTQNGCVSTKLFCVAKNMTQKKLLNYLKSGIFPSYIIGHFLMLAAKMEVYVMEIIIFVKLKN